MYNVTVNLSNRFRKPRGSSLMELLFATCVLSLSLAPLFYIFNFTRRTQEQSELEFTASLLAQHVMEEIVGFCRTNPDAIPPMTGEEPVVMSAGMPRNISEYFREILDTHEGIDETRHPELYWAMKPFTCQVDTYFLEPNLYKVIVYILYEESGQKKRIFVERLVSRSGKPAQE